MSVTITISDSILAWLRTLDARPHLYPWEFVASHEVNSLLLSSRSAEATQDHPEKDSGEGVESLHDVSVYTTIFKYRDRKIKVISEIGKLSPYWHYAVMSPEERLVASNHRNRVIK